MTGGGGSPWLGAGGAGFACGRARAGGRLRAPAAVDSDQFANRATEALRDDSARSLIAEKITDEVVLKNEDDLIAARPLIESVTSAIVGGRAFTELFRKAVRDLHRALFNRDKNTVTLTIADVGTVARRALEQLRPSLAEEGRARPRGWSSSARTSAASRNARRHRRTDPAPGVVLRCPTLSLVGGALGSRRTAADGGRARHRARRGRRRDRRRLRDPRSIAIDHVEGPGPAGRRRRRLGRLPRRPAHGGWILAGSGAVMAAAAASLIKPLPLRRAAPRAAGWVATEPQATVLRVLRGARASSRRGCSCWLTRRRASPGAYSSVCS